MARVWMRQTETIRNTHPSHALPSQMRYLLALEAALAARESVSDTAMAKVCKMSRTTIWEWKHDPSFQGWLQIELDRTSEDHWPLILLRYEHLAIQGSVRSAEFIAKVRFMSARIDGGREAEVSAKDYTVNIIVPRPPALPVHDETN